MALTKIDDRGLKTPIDLLDNEQIRFGTGNDLYLYHNGTDSFIKNITGDLKIFLTGGTEEAALFKKDGGVELFYDGSKKFETHPNGVLITGHIYAVDANKIQLGNDADLQIYHNGSDSKITNSTGGLQLQNSGTGNIHLDPATDENGILIKPNGAVELYYDNSKKLETKSYGVQVSGNIYSTGSLELTTDTSKIFMGGGNDLQIYHDGTHSYIKNTGGSLKFAAGQVEINKSTSETMAKFIPDGAVELYYDNSKKLETSADGITLSGWIYIPDSDGSDNMMRFGNGADLQIYHDGTNNKITSTNGDIHIESSSSGSVQIAKGTSEYIARFLPDSSVQLYYDNSKKLETVSYGVVAKGSVEVQDGSLTTADSTNNGVTNSALFGTGNDLKIYHDGSNSYIDDVGTGGLKLRTAGSATTGFYKYSNSEEKLAEFEPDEACRLYYDNSKKLETTGNGVYIHGDVASSSQCLRIDNAGNDGSNRDFIRFKNDSGTTAGSIQHSGSTSVSYNTSSDYRLKENEVAISDGITRLKTLKPYRFNFKSQPSKTVDGFFAHEVTAVPEAINGEKDGTEMQSLDYSKLTPLLTAALKEAITKIETLETKVAALESS